MAPRFSNRVIHACSRSTRTARLWVLFDPRWWSGVDLVVRLLQLDGPRQCCSWRRTRKPNRSFLKWLFLFMRYFGAASQMWVFNLFRISWCWWSFVRGNQLLSKHVASTVPITLYYCRLWYTWRLVACQTMLTAVEATLIMRGLCF